MICLSISLIFQCGAIQKVWFCLSVNVTFLHEFVAKHNFGRLYSDWIISCKRKRYKLPWCVIWLMILPALQEKFAFASCLIILLIVDVRGLISRPTILWGFLISCLVILCVFPFTSLLLILNIAIKIMRDYQDERDSRMIWLFVLTWLTWSLRWCYSSLISSFSY